MSPLFFLKKRRFILMLDCFKKQSENDEPEPQRRWNPFRKNQPSTDQDTLPVVVMTPSEIRRKSRLVRRESELHFYEGGVRKKYTTLLKWIGRVGFIAKGVVYGCIGVLTLTNLTGAWTPNGSEGNESPQVSTETLKTADTSLSKLKGSIFIIRRHSSRW